MYDIARTANKIGSSRKLGLLRHLHHVEVIKKSIKLIEPMHCRQELVPVTHVTFAELSRGVSLRF